MLQFKGSYFNRAVTLRKLQLNYLTLQRKEIYLAKCAPHHLNKLQIYLFYSI